MRSHWTGPALLLLALLPASVAVAEQAPIETVTLYAEGETYVASHNLGGYDIHIGYCDSASGHYVADGLDVAGEWIELALTLPESVCCAASLAVQGYSGQLNGLRLSFTPAAGGAVAASADFSFTGIGIGCAYPYNWCADSDLLCLDAGDWRARIAFTSGTLARIDRLRLVWESSAAAAQSWSRVKSLYAE